MNRSEIIAFLESQAPNAKAKDMIVRLKREDLNEQLRHEVVQGMDLRTIIRELRKLERRNSP